MQITPESNENYHETPVKTRYSTIRSFGRHQAISIAAASGLPILVLLCLAISALAAFATTHQVTQTSDTVNSALAAHAMLRGNILLSGWTLASDNFLFTDTFPFVVFTGIFGEHNVALMVIPAFDYTVIVALSLIAALRSLRWSSRNIAALAMVMLLIGLPPAGLSYSPLLIPDSHAGSCLLSLAALMLLAALAKSARILDRPFLISTFIFVVFTAVASDPYTIVFAFGPALLVIFLDFLADKDVYRSIRIFLLLALPCILGRLAPLAIFNLGGFATEPNFKLAFVLPKHLGSNFVGFILGFVYSSGADVFGKPVLAAGTIANAARLVGWLLGGIAVVRRFRCADCTNTASLFDRCLLASFMVVASACVFSQQFFMAVRSGVFVGGAGTRYIAPLIVFGAILSARSVPNTIIALPTRRFRLVALGFLAAITGGLAIAHTKASAMIITSPSWVSRNDFDAVSQWLRTHRLTCGIGGYWSAAIITALTHGNVTVRAVIAPPDGRLKPFNLSTNGRWYGGVTQPHFAIWDSHGPALFNVDKPTISRTYGPPTRIKHFGGFTIAVLPPHPVRSGLRVSCSPHEGLG